MEEPGGATVAIGAEEIETRLQRENRTIRQVGYYVTMNSLSNVPLCYVRLV